MSRETSRNYASKVGLDEHQEITQALNETHDLLFSAGRERGRVNDLMVRLSELVEAHFQHEEIGGYLRDCLDRAPHLIGQVDSLHKQYELLQERIDKLQLLVNSGVESPSWWSRIEADFNDFAERLLSHRDAATKLRKYVFTEHPEVDE